MSKDEQNDDNGLIMLRLLQDLVGMNVSFRRTRSSMCVSCSPLLEFVLWLQGWA